MVRVTDSATPAHPVLGANVTFQEVVSPAARPLRRRFRSAELSSPEILRRSSSRRHGWRFLSDTAGLATLQPPAGGAQGAVADSRHIRGRNQRSSLPLAVALAGVAAGLGYGASRDLVTSEWRRPARSLSQKIEFAPRFSSPGTARSTQKTDSPATRCAAWHLNN